MEYFLLKFVYAFQFWLRLNKITATIHDGLRTIVISKLTNIFVVTLVTDFTMVSFVTRVFSVPISTIIAVATIVTSVYWLLWLRERTYSVSGKNIARLVTLCRLSSEEFWYLTFRFNYICSADIFLHKLETCQLFTIRLNKYGFL
jgi:hypothetical protein